MFPTLAQPMFALAGVAAAAAVVGIHLLNRQRQRPMDWAAMEFLRIAIQRSRRASKIRDWLLLLCRVAAMLLLGLAVSQPSFDLSGSWVAGQGSVHLVLVLDNSLSMELAEPAGTLFSRAQSLAIRLIDSAPAGSRFTVIPACRGGITGIPVAHRIPADARDTVSTIQTVDRSVSFPTVAAAVSSAVLNVPEMPVVRCLVIGDQQATNWEKSGSDLPRIPGLAKWEFVAIRPASSENTAVVNVALRDEFATPGEETCVIATVQHFGSTPRSEVTVRLLVGEIEQTSQVVDLEPGQPRDVLLFCKFESSDISAGVVPVSVAISADNLPADDTRCAAIPVLEQLPVLFVDQYGNRENPSINRLGETWPLRALLQPDGDTTSGNSRRALAGKNPSATAQTTAGRAAASTTNQLPFTHARLDQLSREVLQDVRLLVISGVRSPGESQPLLREFVEQGGQLLITAGGEFDPAAWTTEGFSNATGVLPVPLSSELSGALPEFARDGLTPQFIAVDSVSPVVFRLSAASAEEYRDLLRMPVFFQTAVADVSTETLSAILQHDLAAANNREQPNPANADSLATAARWVRWPLAVDEQESAAPERIAARQQPVVLASYDNGTPLLVQRRIGRGEALFMSSGVLPEWNTLSRTHAAILLDQLLRQRLLRTLPDRNHSLQSEVVLPITATQRHLTFSLRTADGSEHSITAEAARADQYALVLRDVCRRGVHRIRALSEEGSNSQFAGTDSQTAATESAATGSAANGSAEPQPRTTGDPANHPASSSDNSDDLIVFCANGLPGESNLEIVTADARDTQMGDVDFSWTEESGNAGLAQFSGTGAQRFDLVTILTALLAIALISEMLILTRRPTTTTRSA